MNNLPHYLGSDILRVVEDCKRAYEGMGMTYESWELINHYEMKQLILQINFRRDGAAHTAHRAIYPEGAVR